MKIIPGKLTMKKIDGDNDRKSSARQAAQKRVYDANHVSVEEWAEIMGRKNSRPDADRLNRLKTAMDRGTIKREPSESVNAKGVVKKFSKAEALRLFVKLVEIERVHVLKEMVDTTPDNYVMILDYDSLREMVAIAMDEPIIALDTETTGLDTFVDVIVGYSITVPSLDRHYYVPITPTEDERALDSEKVLEISRPLFESDDVLKVLHNAAFDIKMLLRHNIVMGGLYWDTMPGMAMLNENEPTFALKNLATKYLREPADSFAELFGKDAKFAEIPLDVALVYAAKDTHVTWQMYEFQFEHISKMPTVLQYFLDVEMKLIPVIVDMEATGFVIDQDYATEYGEKMKIELDEMYANLQHRLGDININSHVQLKEALEATLGIELQSTNASKVLKPLVGEYPLIKKLIEYKELNKLYGTYISVLPTKIHPITGKLHARFNPNGAVTGRFSSGGNGINLIMRAA